eukprot:scaffold82878_cov52-Prasinocladus_malaysianus.AAC.1
MEHVEVEGAAGRKNRLNVLEYILSKTNWDQLFMYPLIGHSIARENKMTACSLLPLKKNSQSESMVVMAKGSRSLIILQQPQSLTKPRHCIRLGMTS